MPPLTPLDTIPEAACRAYERLHGVIVTVHDLGGTLRPYLDPARFGHRHPLCNAIVSKHGPVACTRSDGPHLREDLRHHPEGLIHRCWAGLVEVVVPWWRPVDQARPVDQGQHLDWVLFAGPWRGVALDLPAARRAQPGVGELPPLTTSHAEDHLESLRMLAARLGRWQAEVNPPPPLLPGEVHQTGLPGRGPRIRQWIAQYHRDPVGLADLARYLDLGVPRTSTVVRTTCGRGFADLLRAARLATAADLLRYGDLPVPDVAIRAGFGDLSGFFRAFRTAYGMTPAAYRRSASGA